MFSRASQAVGLIAWFWAVMTNPNGANAAGFAGLLEGGGEA
jgi:hypothetical protein